VLPQQLSLLHYYPTQRPQTGENGYEPTEIVMSQRFGCRLWFGVVARNGRAHLPIQ
jgi:hypothetical protein